MNSPDPAATSPTARSTPRWLSRDRLVLATLALLAFLVYANSLANGFALDDIPIIVDNPRVHGLLNLLSAVTGSYWPDEPARLGMYRPLTSLSFALDWEIWNGTPFGFHLVNVALHAAVTGLVFLLLRRLRSSTAAAAIAAGIFAVHPVHVEAVANIVGRGEILAAAFYLLACLVYLGGGRGWRTAAWTGAAYFLALSSKEIAATLPGALVLLELLRGRGWREAARAMWSRWRVYVAAVAAFVAYMALRYAMIGALLGGGQSAWFWGKPPGTALLTAIRVWPEYLRLMLFPAELVAEYGPAVIVPETELSPLVLMGVAVGVGAAAVAAVAWRQERLISGGIAWFALTVLPVAGVLFPVGVILAERTLYLPSVGLALAVAGLAAVIARERPRWRRPLAVAVLALMAAGAMRTWTRNPVWRSSEAVIADLVRSYPLSFRSQWAMAHHLARQERYDEMVSHLELALAMAPGYYQIREDYAMELFRRGLYGRAAAQFDTLTAIIPDVAEPHVYRLWALVEGGQADRAVVEGARAVDRFPADRGLRHQYARALARVGRWADAETQRVISIRASPPGSGAGQWQHLAALHLIQGDSAAAAAALDSARARTGVAGAIPSIEALRGHLVAGDTAAIPLW